MGLIKQSPFGSIKGAFGNLIGATWKGRGYIKVRPASIANPQTEDQQNQRRRFAACVAMAKSLKSNLIRPVWNKKSGDISGYNFFLQKNVNYFAEDGTIADYDNFMFSVGDLPLPTSIVVQNDGTTAGAIRITWVDNSGDETADATDRLRVVYLTGVTPVVMSGLVFTRNEELATIQLTGLSGQTVHVYVFFEDEKKKNYSNSFHAMVAIPIVPAG
jgi:hypothetical protein